MDRLQILDEIRRTAKENGGAALGWRRFEAETGIGHFEWFGRFWSKWGDAVREAGLEPNRISEAYSEAYLVECLALVTRRLGRVPTSADLRLATSNDPDIPSETVFRRLGSKSSRVKTIASFCDTNEGYADVAALWAQVSVNQIATATEEVESSSRSYGYVYLLKHGSRREYKIGRTNNVLRREGELAIQLPDKVVPVHHIQTDDPAGIEAYWHRRFAAKRKEGEWFVLSPQDVAAFKRWKRIH